MKFQVNKDVLNEAVSFAVRLLPQRTTLPILSGILIEADANALRLSVFDYDTSAQVEIAAKVDQSGRVLVSGRLMAEIINKLPNAAVDFSTDGSKVQVNCGSAKFSLSTMPIDEYPTLPEIPSVSGTVSGDEFASAISQIAVAASKEDVTPVLTTVLLETTKESISLVATDRYRVAVKDIAWKNAASDSDQSALIPAKTLQEIAKTFANQGEIAISINPSDEKDLIAFKANNRSVTSRLIKGNFPAVKTLFPERVENFAVLNTQDLLDSTRRVSLVLERESPIKFSFGSSSVVLEATGGETAQASESIDCQLSGSDVVVSLKPQFLIDGLAGVNTEFVKIGFTNSDNPNRPSPVLITNHSTKEKEASDSYMYLLQPNLLGR
ncbi:MAG: DNA polymerase III subunit beta [Actinomycetota bacterium]